MVFVVLKAIPLFFVRGSGASSVVLVVHVYDVICSGPRQDVDQLFSSLGKELSVKFAPPLCCTGDSCRFLGRTINRLDVGYSVAVDDKLIDLCIRSLNLSSAKTVDTPSVPRPGTISDELLLPLNAEDHHQYRAGVGRLAYISADRFDLMFTVKALSRNLVSPSAYDMQCLKRAVRYISGHRDFTYLAQCTEIPRVIETYVDSDWGSCPQSRRSTSGGFVVLGTSVVSAWSRTQPTVALSSVEAELTAACVGAQESLLIQTLLSELGIDASISLSTDSAGCLSHLSRLGVGRLKHIQLRSAFLQELVRRKSIFLKKILGLLNPADLLTKAVDRRTLGRLLSSPLVSLTCPSSSSSSSPSSDDVDVVECNAVDLECLSYCPFLSSFVM